MKQNLDAYGESLNGSYFFIYAIEIGRMKFGQFPKSHGVDNIM